jgi:hypothetical protein
MDKREKNYYWSETDIEYLKANYKKISAAQIANDLNRTERSVWSKSSVMKLTQVNHEPYSKAEDYFLRNNYQTMSDPEISAKLGRTFNSVRARRRALNLQKNSKMIQRRKCFKKGNIPHNAYDEGTIIRKKDTKGRYYYFIKEQKQGKLKPLHSFLWRKSGREIPEKHIVVFSDGDADNCTLENLECISRAELLIRNRNKELQLLESIKDNPELLELYKTTKILKQKIKTLKKDNK